MYEECGFGHGHIVWAAGSLVGCHRSGCLGTGSFVSVTSGPNPPEFFSKVHISLMRNKRSKVVQISRKFLKSLSTRKQRHPKKVFLNIEPKTKRWHCAHFASKDQRTQCFHWSLRRLFHARIHGRTFHENSHEQTHEMHCDVSAPVATWATP